MNSIMIPKETVKCSECDILPVWGSMFLYCPVCGKEGEYNEPDGNAVKTWNEYNEK